MLCIMNGYRKKVRKRETFDSRKEIRKGLIGVSVSVNVGEYRMKMD
jgi:hypothetical protein